LREKCDSKRYALAKVKRSEIGRQAGFFDAVVVGFRSQNVWLGISSIRELAADSFGVFWHIRSKAEMRSDGQTGIRVL